MERETERLAVEMIRVGYMSDIHLEIERNDLAQRRHLAGGGHWHMPVTTPEEAARQAIVGHPSLGPSLAEMKGKTDLFVLAGDIDLDHRGFEYARQVAAYLGVPIVYIMGNHEGYGGCDLDLMLPELRAMAAASSGEVTFLENESATFNLAGERLHVLGCTLWTDYMLLGDSESAMRSASHGINDHRCIRLRDRFLSPLAAKGLHEASRNWLEGEMARIREREGERAKILIVTHHAPHPHGTAKQHRGGRLSPAFASDMTVEIETWHPVAWIFGHTHYSCQLEIGGVPVVSAQRGYLPDPGAKEFRPRVIELE